LGPQTELKLHICQHGRHNEMPLLVFIRPLSKYHVLVPTTKYQSFTTVVGEKHQQWPLNIWCRCWYVYTSFLKIQPLIPTTENQPLISVVGENTNNCLCMSRRSFIIAEGCALNIENW